MFEFYYYYCTARRVELSRAPVCFHSNFLIYVARVPNPIAIFSFAPSSSSIYPSVSLSAFSVCMSASLILGMFMNKTINLILPVCGFCQTLIHHFKWCVCVHIQCSWDHHQCGVVERERVWVERLFNCILNINLSWSHNNFRYVGVFEGTSSSGDGNNGAKEKTMRMKDMFAIYLAKQFFDLVHS